MVVTGGEDSGYIFKAEPTGFANRLDMSVRQRQVMDDTKILYLKNCNRPDLSLYKYLLHLAEYQAGGFAVRICSSRKHSLSLSLSPQMPPPRAGGLCALIIQVLCKGELWLWLHWTDLAPHYPDVQPWIVMVYWKLCWT